MSRLLFFFVGSHHGRAASESADFETHRRRSRERKRTQKSPSRFEEGLEQRTLNGGCHPRPPYVSHGKREQRPPVRRTPETKMAVSERTQLAVLCYLHKNLKLSQTTGATFGRRGAANGQ